MTMRSIERILTIEELDRDIYRSQPIKSLFRRTFGGQVAAQALVAAIRTVDKCFPVHSLHGYFLRAGVPEQPTIYLVDRIRDGHSFCTRQIRAVQDGETIFSMQASFHREGDVGIEHADKLPEVPGPESALNTSKNLTDEQRAILAEWSDWDIRAVPEELLDHGPGAETEQVVWFRAKAALPDDQAFHICTLAYMSDMTLLHTALLSHPGCKVQMASLDHAMWFLRPFRADEWLLYIQRSPWAGNGRALTYGRIFNQQGQLVAIVNQEGLTRTLQAGKAAIPLNDVKDTK